MDPRCALCVTFYGIEPLEMFVVLVVSAKASVFLQGKFVDVHLEVKGHPGDGSSKIKKISQRRVRTRRGHFP